MGNAWLGPLSFSSFIPFVPSSPSSSTVRWLSSRSSPSLCLSLSSSIRPRPRHLRVHTPLSTPRKYKALPPRLQVLCVAVLPRKTLGNISSASHLAIPRSWGLLGISNYPSPFVLSVAISLLLIRLHSVLLFPSHYYYICICISPHPSIPIQPALQQSSTRNEPSTQATSARGFNLSFMESSTFASFSD
ncbi:hypothetical protein DL95DRAFT_134053 [Leptodontidium sp. 2 PMI_412]|nr:hypothetical protein DL95DRAFT_134053 [Leptodontidium sp. 2 PMI_412]